MPRARSIKPDFFANEELAELPPETRLLFIGLWTLADREGRLEDRPKRIKMQLFAADSFEVDSMLDELAAAGLISRYEVDGSRYIAIPTFAKHQNPHRNERDSVIPSPDTSPQGQKDFAPRTEALPTKDDAARADSGLRTPDSKTDADASVGDASGAGPPPCPHKAIVALYHELLPELRRVAEWTPERQKLLQSRWRENPERQSLDWWRRYFGLVRASPFLLGQADDGRVFQADLEWLIRPRNMPKVIEGKYTQRRDQPDDRRPLTMLN